MFEHLANELQVFTHLRRTRSASLSDKRRPWLLPRGELWMLRSPNDPWVAGKAAALVFLRNDFDAGAQPTTVQTASKVSPGLVSYRWAALNRAIALRPIVREPAAAGWASRVVSFATRFQGVANAAGGGALALVWEHRPHAGGHCENSARGSRQGQTPFIPAELKPATPRYATFFMGNSARLLTYNTSTPKTFPSAS